MISKRHFLRTAVVGVLGAASLAIAGTAMAATPAANVVVAQKAVPAKAGITAEPSVSSVRAWQLFRVTGGTTGLKAGSKVTLQQKQHGKWVSLPASTSISRNGSYSLGVKLGLKGKNDLRIVSGTTASPVFNVTVR
ncbi:hypothetical protein P6B95_00520 [Streptomyces atratus]|uniref:hypothetical protein n=1 Tax=Streptomyces atratus TaxID=1893 RepID=UPI001670ED03|nr:hypothetical protein [Streptomyces atratus]WPW26109.1 hypothetical protein P6B95_00520 [Streptomyces atratus]GGT67773.1 hypothetical protein GCM10010207_78190 [Streptomyces atratus]